MLNIVILLAVIAILALVAIQNAAPVVLTFLFWKFETSLSVIILLSIFAGAFVAALLMISGYVKRFIKNKRTRLEDVSGKGERR